jgi:hypothetical protein
MNEEQYRGAIEKTRSSTAVAAIERLDELYKRLSEIHLTDHNEKMWTEVRIQICCEIISRSSQVLRKT